MRSALQDANTFLRISGSARMTLSPIQLSANRPKPSRISMAILVTSDDVCECVWVMCGE